MYRNESTRSWSSVAIWLSAFASVTLIAAWQFQWFPTDEAEPVPLRPRNGFESLTKKDGSPTSAGLAYDTGTSTEPDTLEPPIDFTQPGALFSHQSEPPAAANANAIVQVGAEFPAPPNNPPADSTTAANSVASGSVTPAAVGTPQPPRLFQADPNNAPKPLASVATPEKPPSGTNAATARPISTGDAGTHPLLVGAINKQPDLSAATAELAQIDQLQEQGTPQADIAAHKLLSKLYWEHPEWRDALSPRIRKTAATIYFSPQPHYMTAYEIQAGDQLGKVAKLYGVPWEYLASLNRTDPKRIRPGQKLKVIKGPFGAVVDLRRFELTVEHHGFVVKRYKIGIGADNSTPIGEFTVRNKLPNPTYYGPNGVVIDANNSENPLGEHWIDIGDSYGIHGTIDDDSIGKAESRGCVRMLNKDVAEVFQFLGIGSKVIIRR